MPVAPDYIIAVLYGRHLELATVIIEHLECLRFGSTPPEASFFLWRRPLLTTDIINALVPEK